MSVWELQQKHIKETGYIRGQKEKGYKLNYYSKKHKINQSIIFYSEYELEYHIQNEGKKIKVLSIEEGYY